MSVKLKPGLSWRTQVVRDARVMGYLWRRAANREWKQPKTKECAAVSKAEQSWRSEGCFAIRHGDAEFSVSLYPVFSHYSPIPAFGIVIYSLCHYMLEICDLLFYFNFTEECS